jgi:hypothetical protein
MVQPERERGSELVKERKRMEEKSTVTHIGCVVTGVTNDM